MAPPAPDRAPGAAPRPVTAARSSRRFTSTPSHVLPPILHLDPPLILKFVVHHRPVVQPHMAADPSLPSQPKKPSPIRPSLRTTQSQNGQVLILPKLPTALRPSTNTQTIPPTRSSPLITIAALSQNSLFTKPSLATNTPPKAEHGCKPGLAIKNSVAFSIVEVGLGLDAHDGG